MIYIGTTNPGKLREFGGILLPLGVEMMPVSLDVPETTDTFDGNARQKALAYAAHTGGVTVSEDSGIVIPALGGLPGPWSAMFADCELDGPAVKSVQTSGRARGEIDRANNERVLQMMREVQQPHRAAKFVVRLVVVQGQEILFEAGAEAHGWIAEEPRGGGGFGYDPIFVGQDTFGRTYAELDPVRKNSRSHRKRVLADFGLWVAGALKNGVIS